MGRTRSNSYDAIVVGGGHNGLVPAACLARSGAKTHGTAPSYSGLWKVYTRY